MLRFEITPEDMLRVRFGISPLFELEALLRKLRSGALRAFSPRLHSRLAPIYLQLRRETDLDLAMFLMTPRRTAGFLCEPVEGMQRAIEDDLAVVRSTDPDKARADIALCRTLWPGQDKQLPDTLNDTHVVERVADSLEAAWQSLLAKDWETLRVMLERDIAQRSAQLGRTGWLVALGDLVDGIRCRSDAIELPWELDDMTLPLNGQGMMLIPSIFVWPSCVVHHTRTPRKLIYPARGVGALRESTRNVAKSGLAEILGSTRAKILRSLVAPSSTTQLSRYLSLPTGSVNDHLSALHRAGLLEKARSGRSVLYYRTSLGDALASQEG